MDSDLQGLILGVAWALPALAGMAYGIWTWKDHKTNETLILKLIKFLELLFLVAGIITAIIALVGLVAIILTESVVLSGLVLSTMIFSFRCGTLLFRLGVTSLSKLRQKKRRSMSEHDV